MTSDDVDDRAHYYTSKGIVQALHFPTFERACFLGAAMYLGEALASDRAWQDRDSAARVGRALGLLYRRAGL